MKIHWRRILSIVMLLSWMSFIFFMSTNFGDSNGKANLRIVQVVKDQTGIDMNKQLGSLSINGYFRKNMHFLEFAILSLIILYVIVQFKSKHSYILSVVFASLYAGSDEFHQIFVNGRTPLFTDVIIDICGAGLTLVIIYIVRKIKLRENKRKVILWLRNDS